MNLYEYPSAMYKNKLFMEQTPKAHRTMCRANGVKHLLE